MPNLTHLPIYLRPGVLVGPEQNSWLDRLEVEHDNLRAALRWFLEQGHGEMALQLGGALWQFWFARGYMSEGRRWLQEALAGSEHVPANIRAKAAGGVAILAAYLGNYGQAAMFAELSLALFRQLDFKLGISAALNGLVFVYGMQGEHDRAGTLAAENVNLCRMVGDDRSLANALFYSALVAWLRGDFGLSQGFLEEALPLFQKVGDRRGIASSLSGLGLTLVGQGRFDPAQPLFEDSLLRLRELGDMRSVTMCLTGLADVALSRDDVATARALAMEAVAIAGEVGDRWFAAYSLDGLAAALTVSGQIEQAAQFFGAASAMREAIGAALPAARQLVHQHYLPLVQAKMNAATFAAAWAQGRSLTLEQVIAAQRQVTLPDSPPLAGSEQLPSTPLEITRLTQREREVLSKVAQGLTDAQVAEQLIISPRTVHSHLASIYSKLGVKSRTAAARYAIEHNLA